MDSTETPSLVWGVRRGGGGPFEARSPLDGSIVASGELLGDLASLGGRDLPPALDLSGLAPRLRAIRSELVDALRLETGFSPNDCEELVEGSFAYAERYADHPSTQPTDRREEIQSDRRMSLIEVPCGTVAAILPHNAFLPLALSCMMNALRAGNRVILRAPLQSARSAGLLASAVEAVPEIAPWVALAVCSARPFVDWFLEAPEPGLLHFFGGSKHAADLVARGFSAGKAVLIDGEGNSWVYVDRDFPADRAAGIVAGGAFRYNGGTCTSVNGAMIHPERYEEVADLVAGQARALEIGPVFDEAQAEWCLQRALRSGGKILAGGVRSGAVLAPTVVESPDPSSLLVREGVFGPALWLAQGDADAFAAYWPSNRYPLCAAILHEPADPQGWAARLPGLARLVLNGDPSVEDPFEFWGGYPPSGQNAVSGWLSKYRRVVQIDVP